MNHANILNILDLVVVFEESSMYDTFVQVQTKS